MKWRKRPKRPYEVIMKGVKQPPNPPPPPKSQPYPPPPPDTVPSSW